MIKFFVTRSQLANKDGKKLFYPRSLAATRTTSTDTIAKELAEATTFGRGEVAGLLKELGSVLRRHVCQGETVVLEGVGSFRLVATARGNGAETKEAVTSAMFNTLKVAFTPESTRSRNGLRSVSLLSDPVHFEMVDAPERSKKKPSDPVTPSIPPVNPGGGSEGV